MPPKRNQSQWEKECVAENEKLVSNFRQCQVQGQKASEKESNKGAFLKLLSKIQGIPPKQNRLLIELTVVYNCILILRSCSTRSLAPSCQAAHIMKVTLNRVSSSTKPTSVLASSQSSLAELIHTALQALQRQPSTGQALRQLVSLYAVHLMLDGDIASAALLLQKLKDETSYQTSIKAVLDILSAASLHTKRALASVRDQGQSVLIKLGEMHVLVFHLEPCAALTGEESSDCPFPVVTGLYPGASWPGSYSDTVSITSLHLAFVHWQQAQYADCLAELQNCTAEAYQVPRRILEGEVLYCERKYDACLQTLHDLHLEHATDLDPSQSAQLANRVGTCWAKKGSHHSAIESYEQSLHLDWRANIPLLNISLAYRALNLPEPEIETLSILVKSLGNPSPDDAIPQSAEPLCPGQLLLQQLCHQRVSFAQALHLLARRCQELARYRESADHYLELLAWLRRTDEAASDPFRMELKSSEHSEILEMPDLQTIYHTTAAALLRDRRYQDTISICDHMLGAYTKTSNQGDSQGSESSSQLISSQSSGPSQSKKRCLSDSSYPVNAEPAYQEDVVAMQAKCIALCASKDMDQAAAMLSQLIATLESSLADERQKLEPDSKRVKLSASAPEAVRSDPYPSCVERLSQAYSCKSQVLHSQGKRADAIHCSRIALQLKPGGLQCVYNHCLLLCDSDRTIEASKLWKKHAQPLLQKVPLQSDKMDLEVLTPMWEEVGLDDSRYRTMEKKLQCIGPGVHTGHKT